ncbi:hypothetical protein [Flaviflexus huanghaiensis]|uniref:hypothetical protein n=1 Tax=Flaviflexus huanghaiensis TaxID=1111473 RepID=UPI0015FAE288|nr:hypothetical protein [Flaviflexus huanghaiensis]
MSALPGALSVFLPLLVRLLRGPGKFMVWVNGALIALLLWLTVSAVADGNSGAWVPLVLGAILGMGVLVFGIRLARLSRYVDELEELQSQTVGTEIVTQDGRTLSEDDARQRFQDASFEASQRTARFMPRVHAAQRAAIAVAGGTVEAPYLKDDLRVTIVSGILTALAGPFGFLLLIVTAIIT